jgi:hypothetical protein
MKRSLVIGLLALAWGAVPGLALAADGKPAAPVDEQRLQAKLEQALMRFADTEGVDSAQMKRALGRLVYGHSGYVQGGAGILGDGSRYVDLRNSRNTVLIRARTLSFSPSARNEVVILQGENVVGSLPYAGDEPITLLDFRPHRIRFLDFATGEGGIYER